MAAPAWVTAGSALLGTLGGLFGGGHHTDNSQDIYKKYGMILDLSMNNYKSVDLNKEDAAALEDYRKMVEQEAQAMLGNLDASTAAAGSPSYKNDTFKDRARTQIALDMASQIGNKKFSLDTTRDARKAALLPNASSYAQGFPMANFLDQRESDRQSGTLNSILTLAGAIPWSRTQSPNNPQNNQVNDRSGMGTGRGA